VDTGLGGLRLWATGFKVKRRALICLYPFALDLIGALDSKSDDAQRDGGEVHRRGRFPARARSMSTATAVPAMSRGNGGVDGVRQVTASSEVRSASSIMSCRGAEGRLECFGQRVSYGRG
jgi:hypothetical protein